MDLQSSHTHEKNLPASKFEVKVLHACRVPAWWDEAKPGICSVKKADKFLKVASQPPSHFPVQHLSKASVVCFSTTKPANRKEKHCVWSFPLFAPPMEAPHQDDSWCTEEARTCEAWFQLTFRPQKWNLKAHTWYQLSPFTGSNVAIAMQHDPGNIQHQDKSFSSWLAAATLSP